MLQYTSNTFFRSSPRHSQFSTKTPSSIFWKSENMGKHWWYFECSGCLSAWRLFQYSMYIHCLCEVDELLGFLESSRDATPTSFLQSLHRLLDQDDTQSTCLLSYLRQRSPIEISWSEIEMPIVGDNKFRMHLSFSKNLFDVDWMTMNSTWKFTDIQRILEFLGIILGYITKRWYFICFCGSHALCNKFRKKPKPSIIHLQRDPRA